jgi:hypothetical protein
MDFKNLKKKIRDPKVSRLLPNVCDFPEENHTLGYGFKKSIENLRPSLMISILCDFHLCTLRHPVPSFIAIWPRLQKKVNFLIDWVG